MVGFIADLLYWKYKYTTTLVNRGGSRNFGKRGPVRERSPEPSAEGASAGWGSGGLPQKILKN